MTPLEIYRAWKQINPLDVAKEMVQEAFRLMPNLVYIEFDFVDDYGSPWIMLSYTDEEGEVCRETIGDTDTPAGFPDFDDIAAELRAQYIDGHSSIRFTCLEKPVAIFN